jgi:hypothetical protein
MKDISSFDQRNIKEVIHISKKYDYIYLSVAKSASSTVKNTLSAKEGIKTDNTIKNVHQRKGAPWFDYKELRDNPSHLKECLENKFKFTFVRNPYTRILSAFLNLFSNDNRALKNFSSAHSLLPEHPLKFFDFLNIIKDDPYELMDSDWVPQCYLLFDQHVHIDKIGYVENFSEDIKYVLNEIFSNSPEQDELKYSIIDHGADSVGEILKYYNQDCIELVAAMYKNDFEYFGYGKDIKNLYPIKKHRFGNTTHTLSNAFSKYLDAKAHILDTEYEKAKKIIISLVNSDFPTFLSIDLSEIEYSLGNKNSAENYLKKAIKKSPHDFVLKRHYADFLFNEKKLAASKEQVANGLKIRENDRHLNSLMCRLHLKEGNFSEAVKYYNICLNSGNPPLILKSDLELDPLMVREKICRQHADYTLPKDSIIGGVASFPKRVRIFEKTVNSILPQLDHLYVFLNNYDEIPDYLKIPKITVFRSQDFEDLSANGKIFYLDKLKSCYFFSLDDDILYPKNYVTTMLESLKKYKNKVAVTVHGSILPEKVNWYFERYDLFPFQHKLETDKFVNLIGSGTFAFHTDTLKTTFENFYPDVMVDLNFSILARRQKVPLVCIARSKRWLKALVKGDGLYQKFTKAETIHTVVARELNPWTYADYSNFIMPLMKSIFHGYKKTDLIAKKLDVDFFEAYESGTIPVSWQPSRLYHQKVKEYNILSEPLQKYRELERDYKLLLNSQEKTIRSFARKTWLTLPKPLKKFGRRAYYSFKKR